MILLTTSRRPTRRIRMLAHDFVCSVPNIVRINRGKLNLVGIAERAVELNANRIVAIDRWKAGLGKIKLFRVEPSDLVPIPPLMYIAGVKLRREFEAKTKYIRSLVVTMKPETPIEIEKMVEHLADFFNLPRLPVDEAATTYETSMHVSLDTQRRSQITFVLLPQMVEIGPRITLAETIYF